MQAVALWNEAPAATRCVVATHCSVSLMIAAVPALGSLFSLSVAGICYGYIPSLALNFLGGALGGNPIMGMLMLLFSTLMALSYFPDLEREHGSLRFVAWLVMTTLSISFPFLAATWLLSYHDPSWAMMSCNGLWPLLIVALTQRCLADPTRMVSFWGLAQISSRWYPFVLVGFFSMIQMRIDISMFLSVMIGVASSNAQGIVSIPALAALKIPLVSMLPSVETAKWIEEGSDAGQRLSGNMPPLERCSGCARKTFAQLAQCCPESLRAIYVRANGISMMPKFVPSGPSDTVGSGPRFVPFLGSGQRLGDQAEV